MHALTNHTQALLDSLLEGATDSHHLAYRLHAGTEFLVNTMELRQVPTGNLTYHIVEGGLEESTRSLGDTVLQFKQTIAHTQLSSNESQGIASGL